MYKKKTNESPEKQKVTATKKVAKPRATTKKTETSKKSTKTASTKSVTSKTTTNRKKTSASDKLLDQIVKVCSDAKGTNITALDVKESFGLCDYFVIVSARSDRQVQGICNRLLQEMAQQKIKPLSTEGVDKGHWALVDFDDIVVHVFYEPVRQEYDLESLWQKARKVKLNIPDDE